MDGACVNHRFILVVWHQEFQQSDECECELSYSDWRLHLGVLDVCLIEALLNAIFCEVSQFHFRVLRANIHLPYHNISLENRLSILVSGFNIL